MKYSRQAHLNLGISVAIWSFVPIFVAIPDRIFYNTKVEKFHVTGMVLLVAMTIIEALSDPDDSLPQVD